jgi:hypothetical protein
MPAENLQQYNLTQPLVFILIAAADHISPVVGATPTVVLSKAGSPFTPAAGAVSEIGNGWYQVAPNAGDANTLGPLILHASATGADPVDTQYAVVSFSPLQVVPTAPQVVTPAAGPGVLTFEDVWRKVRLYAPNAPLHLVRTWVQDAFRALVMKRQWGWVVAQDQITFAAARQVDCVVTLGSTLVTAAVATFVAGDAGRQFRQGTWPIYTILSVAADGSSVTLSLAYQGLSAGVVSATISDCYATMPVDFGAFVVVVDPIYQRMVPWWGTQMELDLIDPNRTAADATPRLLVPSSNSVFSATRGQMQYEYWPKPTAAGALQYYYARRPGLLADTDAIPGLLQSRVDILETGALARAAKWPGTLDQKNPYFNLMLARTLDADFELAAQQLDLRDDDQWQQSFDTIPWQRWSMYTWAYSTHLLQASDATLSSYANWGGGSLGW